MNIYINDCPIDKIYSSIQLKSQEYKDVVEYIKKLMHQSLKISYNFNGMIKENIFEIIGFRFIDENNCFIRGVIIKE